MTLSRPAPVTVGAHYLTLFDLLGDLLPEVPLGCQAPYIIDLHAAHMIEVARVVEPGRLPLASLQRPGSTGGGLPARAAKEKLQHFKPVRRPRLELGTFGLRVRYSAG